MGRASTNLLSILLTCLCLLFCACDGDIYEIDLRHTLEEDGEYVYPGLTWGASPEEVSCILGFEIIDIPLTQAETNKTSPVSRVMTPKNEQLRVKLNGNFGAPRFQFSDDRLVSVTLYFKTNLPGMERNNLKSLYENTDAQLLEMFGLPSSEAVDQAVPNTDAVVSSHHWNGVDDGDPATRNSILSIGYVKDADGNIITVSVMAAKSIIAGQN